MFGIISALLAASSWTYACFLWRQQTKWFSALQINIIKNIIAFVVFFPALLIFDFDSSFKAIFILLLSGIIGIALGDSFYITSLKIIGTRRTLTVEAFSPICATILGSVILQEMPSLKVSAGIFIVSISLLGVALHRTKSNQILEANISKMKGFAFAFLSVLCAVIAATLSRFVLTNSDLNPFQTTEIRLLGGIIGLFPFIERDLITSIKKLPSKNKSSLIKATFLGTNLGILFQQNVFRTLPLGLGWTLLSTSPVISLFVAKEEGEKLDWETLLLTTMTIFGIGIVLI
ncbi:DMT family transporter [Prochlorococcus sp. MIT 1341]|uniref:DMT family transporter n=1 Tax=Prochlorococcus sp. MIT 1341 TaxID=3096221 RepID=UPI002A75D82D|nr:DMT family transporter [Prochlorococcus sp. MIT 1341]